MKTLSMQKLTKKSYDLTDNLNLSYRNKDGELFLFKIDENGYAYFHHIGMNGKDEFVPTAFKHLYILSEEENLIIQLYEQIAFVKRKNIRK